MKNHLEINADIGEGFGPYSLGEDEKIMDYVDAVNIACGFHAGDFMTMDKTVIKAIEKSIKIGAHPGYPDRYSFGRRPMTFTNEEIRAQILYQIGAIKEVVAFRDGSLNHVKLHGAMYNQAATDIQMARAIAKTLVKIDKDLIFLGLSGSEMQEASREVGIQFKAEVFADRKYTESGLLVSRQVKDSLIETIEDCIKQVKSIVEHQRVEAITGRTIPLKGDSLCVHGDSKKALNLHKQFIDGIKSIKGVIVMKIVFSPCGDSAINITFGHIIAPEINEHVYKATQSILLKDIEGITDLVPSYCSLTVHYNPLLHTYSHLKDLLKWTIEENNEIENRATKVVKIPVCYGGQYGPDIENVATHNGMSVEDVIKLHSEARYRVYMIGFQVGFPYLGGMNPLIATPRLSSPRLKVLAGSVGIAGQQTGIYPNDSPGGWQIIGRTPKSLVDYDSLEICLLSSGDMVEFVPITEEEYLVSMDKESLNVRSN